MNLQGKIKRLIREAARQGFRHEWLGSGHHRFYAPDGVSIVQCSATTRDGPWFGKFMTEMRKAGYDDGRRERKVINGSATTSLGEVLQEAQRAEAAPSPEPARPPRKGVQRDIIRDWFRQHPDRTYGAVDVGGVLRSKGLATTGTQAGVQLAGLCKEGFLRRRDKGRYQLEVKEERMALPSIPVLAPIEIASEESPDERELDEALAALGRIELVVRKYKKIARQFAALKKTLAGMEIE